MNFRRGLHRVFLLFALLWIIGGFVYPLYTAGRSNQIYAEALDECMKSHNANADIDLCEQMFKIETDYVPQFVALNYQGQGLIINIAVALFVPLLAYGIIHLTTAIAIWLRRGFLSA